MKTSVPTRRSSYLYDQPAQMRQQLGERDAPDHEEERHGVIDVPLVLHAGEGVEHEGRSEGDDTEPPRLRSPRERNQRGHRQEGPEGGVIVEEQSNVELDVVLVLCAPKGGRSIHLEQLGEHSGLQQDGYRDQAESSQVQTDELAGATDSAWSESTKESRVGKEGG